MGITGVAGAGIAGVVGKGIIQNIDHYNIAQPQQIIKISIKIGNDEIDLSDSHGESFSQMLLRKIDECGMKDSEVYKKAQVSKQLFSKIRSDIHYQPKKGTVIAFALALSLNLDETRDLLNAAGFLLRESRPSDRIIIACINHRIFNLFKINEYLYECGLPLLGSQ